MSFGVPEGSAAVSRRSLITSLSALSVGAIPHGDRDRIQGYRADPAHETPQLPAEISGLRTSRVPVELSPFGPSGISILAKTGGNGERGRACRIQGPRSSVESYGRRCQGSCTLPVSRTRLSAKRSCLTLCRDRFPSAAHRSLTQRAKRTKPNR